jgi:hypothetical protein
MVMLRVRSNCRNDQEVCVPSHMAADVKTQVVVPNVTCELSEVLSSAGKFSGVSGGNVV